MSLAIIAFAAFMGVLSGLTIWSGLALDRLQRDRASRLSVQTAETVVAKVVTAIHQAYVDPLKEHRLFDDEACEIAFKRYYDTTNALLTDPVKADITRVYGNFDKWLDVEVMIAIRNCEAVELSRAVNPSEPA